VPRLQRLEQLARWHEEYLRAGAGRRCVPAPGTVALGFGPGPRGGATPSADHARVLPDPLSDHPVLCVLGDPARDLLPIDLVTVLRTLTVLLVGSVSPTIYTKINCYDRLGSSGPCGSAVQSMSPAPGHSWRRSQARTL